jgi:disulfide bond formation protein DsbB
MSIQTMRLLFALLALAANAAFLILLVLAIGGRISPAIASARDTVVESLRGLELWSAFALASTAMLGSLYLSEIADFIPCTLCWYQRIAMYPLVPLLGIAAWRRDHGIDLYAAVLAIVGAFIAGYHYLLQTFPSLDSGSCNPLVPCTAAYIRQFDFITIPYMALSAFLLILALLWADRRNSSQNAPSSGTEPVATLPT